MRASYRVTLWKSREELRLSLYCFWTVSPAIYGFSLRTYLASPFYII